MTKIVSLTFKSFKFSQRLVPLLSQLNSTSQPVTKLKIKRRIYLVMMFERDFKIDRRT